MIFQKNVTSGPEKEGGCQKKAEKRTAVQRKSKVLLACKTPDEVCSGSRTEPSNGGYAETKSALAIFSEKSLRLYGRCTKMEKINNFV